MCETCRRLRFRSRALAQLLDERKAQATNAQVMLGMARAELADHLAAHPYAEAHA